MKQLISFQKKEEPGEAHGVNRWMVSYADFVTLLFVLFLVLYAKMPRQIATILPATQTILQPIIPGIRAPAHKPAVAQKAAPDKRNALQQDLSASLFNLIEAGDISLITRQEGVLLEIKDTTLFASGTAQPAEQAAGIISKISTVLEKDDNLVVVEGHTDNVPIQNAQYPSNWELSSARAASVVRALQERGISPYRLTASGLAETKPRSTNETAQGRSENRRVSLLILNI